MAPRRFVPRWLPSAWHTPFQSNPFRALSPFITFPLRREEGGEDRGPPTPSPGTKGPPGWVCSACKGVGVWCRWGGRAWWNDPSRRAVEPFSPMRWTGTAPAASRAAKPARWGRERGWGLRGWAACETPTSGQPCGAKGWETPATPRGRRRGGGLQESALTPALPTLSPAGRSRRARGGGQGCSCPPPPARDPRGGSARQALPRGRDGVRLVFIYLSPPLLLRLQARGSWVLRRGLKLLLGAPSWGSGRRGRQGG